MDSVDADRSPGAAGVLLRKHSNDIASHSSKHHSEKRGTLTSPNTPQFDNRSIRRRSSSLSNVQCFLSTPSACTSSTTSTVSPSINNHMPRLLGLSIIAKPSSSHEDLTRSNSFRDDELHARSFLPSDLEVGPLIGKGFFGEVFRVTDRTTGQVMVMKKLYRLDPKFESRFLKEATVMRQLNHPNVLRFIGTLFTHNKQLHLLTEFISGGSLRALIDDPTQPFPWCQRISVAKDVADGMAYLHSRGIIHRDLNSGNILIRPNEPRGLNENLLLYPETTDVGLQAVVADFGLVRLMSTRRSRKGDRRDPRRLTVVGSPYWMAPEMLKEGQYDNRVDIFSFGITLCEIIGRCSADPDILPRTSDYGLNRERFLEQFCTGCPKPLCAIVFRCTAVQPTTRPPFELISQWLEQLNKLENQARRRNSVSLNGLINAVGDYERLSNTIETWQPEPSPTASDDSYGTASEGSGGSEVSTPSSFSAILSSHDLFSSGES